jgi:hypothetical protein
VSLVNHRLLNASIYGSIALLKSAAPTLSKTRMSIRATNLGVTSFDFPSDVTFVSWAFTRNPEHCARLAQAKAVDGHTRYRREGGRSLCGGYIRYMRDARYDRYTCYRREGGRSLCGGYIRYMRDARYAR